MTAIAEPIQVHAPPASEQAPPDTPVDQPAPATTGEQRIAMTYEDYLQRFDDHAHVEWANGEAIVFMPPTARHQRLVRFLTLLIGNLLQIVRRGEVFSAPFQMRLSPESGREPDIVYVAAEHADRVQEKRLVGPADLVIEIISDESLARDRSDKFYEYQGAGVREYWIIDPRPGLTRADFWVLDDDGRYRPVPIAADGSYTSNVLPELRIHVADLLADELPDPLPILARMVGADAIMAALRGEESQDA